MIFKTRIFQPLLEANRLPVLIFLINFLGPFSGNMVLPMFESLKNNFAVGVFMPSLSITFFMIPFSLIQLLSGMLSELFCERRVVILSGLNVFCLGSLIAVFSPNIWFFLASRMIQGVGSALTIPLAMAMVGDFFDRNVRRKIMGGVAVSVTLGPLLGGLLASVNWRLGFITLFILGVPS